MPRSAPMLYAVLLDRFHLDDPLFVNGLGRLLSGAPGPFVLVHGDGGLAARALEAAARFDATPEEKAAATAAATRALGLRLATKLTDAGVPAVAYAGSDRGLLRRSAEGALEAPGVAALATLAAQGAVPVVGAVVMGAEGLVPVAPEAVVGALVQAWPGMARAVVLTRTPRAGLGTPPEGQIAPERLDLYAAELADPVAAAVLAGLETGLLVTSPAGLAAPGGPQGTAVKRA